MICDVCRHDAPYTHAQLARRQMELDRNPTLDIFPCPECGGRDYMISPINLNRAPPLPEDYDGILSSKIKALRPPPQRSWWRRLCATLKSYCWPW